jgi:hypothetical protein
MDQLTELLLYTNISCGIFCHSERDNGVNKDITQILLMISFYFITTKSCVENMFVLCLSDSVTII